MNNYKYTVHYSAKFKKNLKKMLKQGKDIDKLLDVVDKLACNESLDQHYKNHRLYDNKLYRDCYELHIEPDWLLVYQYSDNELILVLVNTGSHSEVLNM